MPAPRLRFKQFEDSGEWGEKALEGIAAFINQKTAVNQLEANKYISTENILPDFGGIEITDKKPENGNATKFKAGDLLLSNIRPYLKKVWAAEWDGGASNDVIVVRALNALNPIYLAHTLKNDDFINYTMRGAKGLKMPRGDIEAIRQYPVPLPPTLPEQIHIAACLSSLDAVIDAHTDKLDALRQHKRALMQQLFPQEGEKVPRLRFPEFEGAGEWEEKRLGEVAYLTAGATPSTSKKEYWGGDIPWMASGDIHQKRVTDVIGRITELGLKSSSTKILPVNSVLVALAGQGKTRGTVATNAIELCTNQSIAAIIPTEEIDYKFLFLNLDSRYEELRFLSTGEGGRGGLNLGILRDVKIPLPPKPEEQTRIAACLSSLDDLIKAQSEKIDELKTFKRGLMQGLFPSTTNHEAAE